ncbi:SRPBCC domain-containing protein [soil metagenome]
MNNQPFVIERTYNAPVARVWKALTDKEAMKQWYFDLAEFKLEVGFEFQFEGKGNDGFVYNHLCRITDVIPQKKLQHTWGYEGYEGSTLVTIELFAEGDKTRVKLTHEGIETLPNLPAFAKQNFVNGWTAIIGTNLAKYVEEESVK